MCFVYFKLVFAIALQDDRQILFNHYTPASIENIC